MKYYKKYVKYFIFYVLTSIMDSYVESAKNQIAENVYITFKEIIDGM